MTIQTFLTVADLEREGIGSGFFDLAAFPRPSTVDGAIDFTTDEDYYIFSPFPNTRYRVSVDSNVDTMLGLYGLPDLSLIADDDDSGRGLNPEIVFDTSSVPEAFILQVDQFDNGEPGGAVFAEGGHYTLTIEDLGQSSTPPALGDDRTGSTPATGGSLAPGELILDQLDSSFDIDSFSIFVEAGHTYRADLTRNPFIGGGIDDPFLTLAEQDGTIIDSDDDSGGDLNASLSFTAVRTGFLSLEVTDFAGDRGGYDLVYFETAAPPLTGPDRIGDFIFSSALIEQHEPVRERIETGDDFDVYEVALTGGDIYRASVIGLGGFDPTLGVLDGTGFELFFNDDAGPGTLDSEITFRAPATDFFYLDVTGFGGDTGNYDLLIEPVRTVAATIGEAQDIALLYEAGLGRQAAFTGLNFWIDSFEAGRSMIAISQEFLDSFEFSQTVGDPDTLTDGQFVDALFINVIGRPAAEPGFEFWTGRLEAGASRAEVLLAFATAEENADLSPNVQTIGQIGQADDQLPPAWADPQPEWDFFVVA